MLVDKKNIYRVLLLYCTVVPVPVADDRCKVGEICLDKFSHH